MSVSQSTAYIYGSLSYLKASDMETSELVSIAEEAEKAVS